MPTRAGTVIPMSVEKKYLPKKVHLVGVVWERVWILVRGGGSGGRSWGGGSR